MCIRDSSSTRRAVGRARDTAAAKVYVYVVDASRVVVVVAVVAAVAVVAVVIVAAVVVAIVAVEPGDASLNWNKEAGNGR